MLMIDGDFFSCSVDAGFILVLPLHHGELELESIGVLMKSGYLGDLVDDSE